jgi:hypothetical protein
MAREIPGRQHLSSALPLPTLALLAATLLACGGAEHPELLGDSNDSVNPNADDSPACREVDAGSCDDTPSAPRPANPEFHCLTEEQTADFDDPLSSVVEAFDTDLFTRGRRGAAAHFGPLAVNLGLH